MTSDLGTFGSARFRTIVEMTGDIAGQLPADALSRIVCFYLLSHLKGAPLKEACEVLYEIYGHSLEKIKSAPSVPDMPQRIHTKPKIRPIERQPFYISE
jgi:hypothetical protein